MITGLICRAPASVLKNIGKKVVTKKRQRSLPRRSTLWRAVADIGHGGYAETGNKRVAEGASISAAMRVPANEAPGALTVSTPFGRYTAEVRGRAIEVVTRTATTLSGQLGAPAQTVRF
jgi:DNA-binding IclR family transcriptional regulator